MFHVLYQTVLINCYTFNIVQYYDILLNVYLYVNYCYMKIMPKHTVEYAQTLTFCTVISAHWEHYRLVF